MVCGGDENDLYEEVIDWLNENVGPRNYSLSDRDHFGMSMTPNQKMKSRYDIEVAVPDDVHAVQFKLRFAEELAREGINWVQRYLTSWDQMMSSQIMTGAITTNTVNATISAATLNSMTMKVRYAEPDLHLSRAYAACPSSDDVGDAKSGSTINSYLRSGGLALHHGSCINIKGV